MPRVNTWDISASENESDEVKPSSSSCVILEQDAPTSSRSCSGGADGVKISGRRKRRRRRREEVQEELETRKAAKEKQRKEKEKKLQEQQWRKEAAERLNLLKPENFIKSLTAHIHAGEEHGSCHC